MLSNLPSSIVIVPQGRSRFIGESAERAPRTTTDRARPGRRTALHRRSRAIPHPQTSHGRWNIAVGDADSNAATCHHGRVRDLATLVGHAFGWDSLVDVTGINDREQIFGKGFRGGVETTFVGL
jgi:hypothetical protein